MSRAMLKAVCWRSGRPGWEPDDADIDGLVSAIHTWEWSPICRRHRIQRGEANVCRIKIRRRRVFANWILR